VISVAIFILMFVEVISLITYDEISRISKSVAAMIEFSQNPTHPIENKPVRSTSIQRQMNKLHR